MVDSVDPIKQDFRNFLYIFWHWLGLGDPTPLQYDIAYQLQHGPRRKGILGFRGVAKSWITAAYVLWCLYCDPVNEKILVVSASNGRAKNFVTFCKRCIEEWDLLQHLRPDESRGQRNGAEQFDVGPARPDQAPSVKASGINGQIVGSRASKIVGDDVEIPRNSDTPTKREQLVNATAEFDAIILPGGEITYLGTYQTEESIYKGLPDRGYVLFVYPARIPSAQPGPRGEPSERERYGTSLGPYILGLIESGQAEGTSTEPTRFSNEDLLEREASWGRSGFALQFMLDPSLTTATAYPLKLADLIVLSLAPKLGPRVVQWGRMQDLMITGLPVVGFSGDRFHRPLFWSKDDWTPYQGTGLFVDPAGRGTNETAYCVIAALNGMLFLLKWGGLLGGANEENLDFLAQLAKQYGVTVVMSESNMGDGMWNSLFRPVLAKYHRCSLEEVKSTIQKERRIIDTLEPITNQHRLVVDEAVIREDYESVDGRSAINADDKVLYRGFFQFTHIRAQRDALKFDDRVDVLALGCAYWKQRMEISHGTAAEQQKAADLEREMKEHIANQVGGVTVQPLNMFGRVKNWIRHHTKS